MSQFTEFFASYFLRYDILAALILGFLSAMCVIALLNFLISHLKVVVAITCVVVVLALVL